MKNLNFVCSLITIMLCFVVFTFLCLTNSEAKNRIVLTKNNTVVLQDEINGLTTSKVLQQAMALDNDSSEPIYLVLDTPGGEVQSGLEMIAGLKGLKRPIHTITFFAASMGFQTVQQLGKRLVLKHAVLMAHKARGGFMGEFPGQLDSRYQYYIKRINELDAVTVGRTNGKIKSVKEFQDMYENEFWVDGFDAINLGLADEIIVAACDKTLNTTHKENFDVFGVQVGVVFSNCPVIRGPVSVEIGSKIHMTVPEHIFKMEIEKIKNRVKELREKARNL